MKIIKIFDEAYRCIDDATFTRRYNDSTQWTRGLKNTNDDPKKTERWGLLGEATFDFCVGREIKLTETYKRWDGEYKNKRIQIKTVSPKFDTLLVKKDGNTTADVYIFINMLEDNRAKKYAKLSIAGWCTKEEAFSSPIKPTKFKNGDWCNYNVPRSILKPLDSL